MLDTHHHLDTGPLEERLGSNRFHLHIHDAVADFARRTRAEQPPAHAQPRPAASEPATNESKKPPTHNG